MNANMSFTRIPRWIGLYPIVDSVAWLVRMLEVGVSTVQLRIKNRQERQIEQDVEAAVLLGLKYNARVFINDYWRLAIQYGAYGVHLGQQDMQGAETDKLLQSGVRLGISTHNKTELEKALAWKPSYISLGHIFPTTTKTMPSAPQGIETLRRFMVELQDIPTVAIGGINHKRAKLVLECGVGGIAVVSAITHATNWRQATSDLQKVVQLWESKCVG